VVAAPPPGPEAFLPARRAPLAYFGFAHGCLVAGLALLALHPEMGGFYYHPRLIAAVHLVTLGFISSAILGAFYLVCPLAFRAPLPEGRGDLAAALSWMLAVIGLSAHFWLDRYAGVAWSGGLALLTPLWLGGRVLAALRRSPAPLEARLPLGLAVASLYAAGALGVLLAVNKTAGFLPASQLDAVHAHLHLGVAGFATLTVIGAGYRILPMVLPAAMPRGPLALASGLLVAGGTWGLAAALLFAKAAVPAAALAVLAGLALFLSRVAFMLRHRRPPPAARPRPDLAVVHVLQSFVYLLLAAACGLFLALAPPSDATLRVALAYGVCGLLGFLCQLVIGVEARLVPMAAWLQAWAAGGHRALPPSVHSLEARGGAAATLALWTSGVPALALGLGLDRPLWTSLGAGALAVGVAVVAAAGARALFRLRAPLPAAQDGV
jgi:hypothetical protein